MRASRLPGRALAPTSAMLRASSMAVTAASRSRVSMSTGARDGILSSGIAGLVTGGRMASADPAAGRALVRDRGPGLLHAGDAADPAAGVGGRAGVVQAGHRGAVVGEAWRGPHVEQLLQGQLAVEDVAADQAVLVFHLVRAHDVGVDDRALEVRSEEHT